MMDKMIPTQIKFGAVQIKTIHLQGLERTSKNTTSCIEIDEES
ncbi:hypothetical protein HMPREF0083_04069 [Aneurinibacillus aneurinilyticus ATCC 12856]|uniref:Uncharacterized protein n=1 Tax=Aneurinibacillus aneurinilyticus ATCC 12856 TaxID=649747 RepID=U1Y6P3_ANEAE|nr:hypothetical protein HMPREF0083_04069 [Aneurinibacillus aneurinilyticus ATCC 12856]